MTNETRSESEEAQPSDTGQRLEEVGERLRRMKEELDASVAAAERAGESLRDRHDQVSSGEAPQAETSPLS